LSLIHTERERRMDYRFGVLATVTAKSRKFSVESAFPSLASAGAGGKGNRNRWTIEEIPDDWVKVTGDEAASWALWMQVDALST
jgi:hypothetical protein